MTGSIRKTIESLRRNGFSADFYESRESFFTQLLKDVDGARTISVGGSVSVRELGIIERLEAQSKQVIHHWVPGLTEAEDEPLRRKEMAADAFLTSTNALTETGCLVNIDGVGNRVAAMIFGPKLVLVVAGINKIVRDVEEGISRAKNVAAPPNAKRVKAKVPCAQTGKCEECDSPRRICRVITIHERPPFKTKVRVYLLNEPLGF